MGNSFKTTESMRSNGYYASNRGATWRRCRSNRRVSKMRPISAYAATFETMNQYHFTPKWKVKLIGRIGHVNRASWNQPGCEDMGIAKLRITQTPATIKPTCAHRPILRCIVSHLSATMLRRDESRKQLTLSVAVIASTGTINSTVIINGSTP
jgi:hypothetical protein